MRWRQVALLYAIALVLAADQLVAVPRDEAGERAAEKRRPRVLRLDLATLSEITIEHGGRRLVARRDGEGWRVEEPSGVEVPSDLVQAFAVAVLEADEIERQDEPADLTPFGLDDGATRVEVRPAGGAPETLWLGASNPSGTAVYARHLGSPGVLLVGRTLRYYEELLIQALPQPAVPAGTADGPVAAAEALTLPGRPL